MQVIMKQNTYCTYFYRSRQPFESNLGHYDSNVKKVILVGILKECRT